MHFVYNISPATCVNCKKYIHRNTSRFLYKQAGQSSKCFKNLPKPDTFPNPMFDLSMVQAWLEHEKKSTDTSKSSSRKITSAF